MIVIGMMSGTSTDGIDAVVVGLYGMDAGRPNFQILKHINVPFSDARRAEILACLRPDTGTVDRICALNFELGETYAEVALQAMRAAKLAPSQIDLIANHGQTIWHIPQHSTLQIGSAAVIAERTGVTTISNFRSRDIAAGGHGAPMVAYVDQLLFTDQYLNRGLQNIGGIANVTWLPANHPEKSFAFDSGPGNVLIDDAVRRATNGKMSYDAEGKIAARGQISHIILQVLLQHPYLIAPPPKTTGREVFGSPYGETLWKLAGEHRISSEDLITTLTYFTARSIADSYKNFLPAVPDEIIVSGGGAKNPTLIYMLQNELGSRVSIRWIEEFGIPSDAKEALAFAILGWETWNGRPSNLPAATGARHPVIQGDITPGARFRITAI
jgi:anhydro-N-acetylmuramic acid kinase